MVAKRHDDAAAAAANVDRDFDYESMILDKVKSSDSQEIGTITLILEDILCVKDKDNQHFGLSKDDISTKVNKEIILKKSYSDVLKSKVKLPEEVYNRNAIKEVKVDLIAKGKAKRKGLFSFITDRMRSDSPAVFSNDGQKVGRLLKASKDYLTILSFNENRQGFEYMVKRSHIEEFDGWRLALDLPFDKVETIMKGQRHMTSHTLPIAGTRLSTPPTGSGVGLGIAGSAGCSGGFGGGGGRGC